MPACGVNVGQSLGSFIFISPAGASLAMNLRALPEVRGDSTFFHPPAENKAL